MMLTQLFVICECVHCYKGSFFLESVNKYCKDFRDVALFRVNIVT